MKRFIIILFFTYIFLPVMDCSADGLSMGIYQRLQIVEKLIAENKYEDAKETLSAMLSNLPPRLADKAYVYYTTGMFYLNRSDLKQAKTYFLLAWKENAFPEKTTLYILETLAGLHMQEEDYETACDFYRKYMALSPEPKKGIYLGLGTAYFYLERYPDAVEILEEAVTRFEPEETVHLMLFSAYYELSQPDQATRVMEIIVRNWPDKKKYWMQLSALYIEQKTYDKSLEIMQAARNKDFDISEKDLLQYVYTLYEEGLPFKAACVLKNGMEDNTLKKNRKNYELLSTMFQEARERLKAIDALKQASACSNDGKNDLYIAQLYFEMEGAFPHVVTHAKKAIEKGIKQEGNAHMLIAVSYIELDQTKNARKHLEIAVGHEESKKAAGEWLKSFGK